MKLRFILISWLSLIAAGILVGFGPSDEARRPAVDLYGDPLPDGAVARLGTVRFRQGHVGAVSPDGKMLATSYGGVIRLVDCQTGKTLRQTLGHQSGALAMAWSKNGKTIASGCWASQEPI